MNAENLKNALIFMERASATGKECIAWVQTYLALQADLTEVTKSEQRQNPPKDSTP